MGYRYRSDSFLDYQKLGSGVLEGHGQVDDCGNAGEDSFNGCLVAFKKRETAGNDEQEG